MKGFVYNPMLTNIYNLCNMWTEALLSAIPSTDPDRREMRLTIKGDVPSPTKPPSGCRFHTRCEYARAECAKVEPPLRDAGGGRCVACHFPLG
ncbi:MAG: oligopeptide/dipeptide ABC transporter ATP-binding protein [Bacillota bacterium]